MGSGPAADIVGAFVQGLNDVGNALNPARILSESVRGDNQASTFFDRVGTAGTGKQREAEYNARGDADRAAQAAADVKKKQADVENQASLNALANSYRNRRDLAGIGNNSSSGTLLGSNTSSGGKTLLGM